MNAGAQYYVEGQYVTADDSAAGNGLNNVSHREATVAEQLDEFPVSVPPQSTTQREEPAILAWRNADPDVVVQNIDIAGDGRLILAGKASPLTAGLWHYEYASG